MKHAIQEEIQNQDKRGVFLILTGPTGAGKDVVLAKLQEKLPRAHRIITTTSRQMRPQEEMGKPYHFISREQFEEKIANHEFFEWVEFRGNLYGTQKDSIESVLHNGSDAILKIETKGVKNIKAKIKVAYPRSVFVFLTASELSTLEARVRHDEHGKPSDRWNPSLAAWEMEQYDDCDYLVVNNDGKLDEAASKIMSIIEAKRIEIIKESTEQ